MKRIILFAAILFCGSVAMAQDVMKDVQTASAKTAPDGGKAGKNGWRKGGSISINLTQVGNSNWIAAGGDKFSLSTAGSLNLFANKTWGRKTWVNILDVNYGLVNTTTLGVRKINDRLDFLTKLSCKPKHSKAFSWAALAQLRSQLTSGYEYDYFGSGTKRRNSGFFAPAYIVVAPIGIEWQPNSWFNAYASPLSARWTIVTNGPYSYAAQGGIFEGNVETPLSKLYGVDPVDEQRGEFGLFITATARKEIMKNVHYYGKIDLYSNYLKEATNMDLFMTNQFNLKVNKFINVTYNLDLMYDHDIKQKNPNPFLPARAHGLQVLSTLGVGFNAKF
jgi:Protein of unknown function (DUF3078)